jgi:uncharacterized membrane protein YdjX (TVP38/TMEM64 family)
MRLKPALSRRAGWIGWLSVAAIVLGLFAIAQGVPPELAARWLAGVVDRAGAWGAAAFVAVYVVAATCLFPGWILGVAAGALFGPVVGTALVSAASTATVAVAFLISRYLARRRVAAGLEGHPRFAAIDRAIGREGWKIVVLLRLSPAVPFNLQNYLYGLTSIGFWPCVLASWASMLPGTFLYVYLGHVGGMGLRTAAGGPEVAPFRWALLGAGLAATVAVTAYITRIARRTLAEAVRLEAGDRRHEEEAAGATAGLSGSAASDEQPPPWPWRALVLAGAAIVVLGLAAAARWQADEVRAWLERAVDPPPGAQP